jgi:hypothetical protein
MEDDMIKIGLDTLLFANQVKKGETRVDLTPIIRKMMEIPARSKLLKRIR